MHPWAIDSNGIVLSARDEMLVRMKADLALSKKSVGVMVRIEAIMTTE